MLRFFSVEILPELNYYFIIHMKKSVKPKNILIMKPGAIGDLLHLTPTIRALKTAYPDTKISLLVGSEATADLFRYNPYISETLIFDKRGAHKSIAALIRLWQYLRRQKYDVVINFQRSNLKTWFLATAAFPCRVLVYHKTMHKIIHAVADHMKTVWPLGVTTSDMALEFYVGEDDNLFAKHLLDTEGMAQKIVIALNPGASHPVNRWPVDRFAALADMLAENIDAKIVIIGGKEDISLADEIAEKTAARPIVIAGKTNLLQLGAVLSRCDVLVTGDTGPMHMATAVGAKVVALFGAADPQRTGPVGSGHRILYAKDVPCIPCRSRKCTNTFYLECMKKISAKDVYDEILYILREKHKIPSAK